MLRGEYLKSMKQNIDRVESGVCYTLILSLSFAVALRPPEMTFRCVRRYAYGRHNAVPISFFYSCLKYFITQ